MSNFDNPYAAPRAGAVEDVEARRADGDGAIWVDASKRARLANFLIDSTVVVVLQILLSTNDPMADWLIAVLVSTTYYSVTEGLLGRSPAKFLTKTRVISIHGGPPTFGAAVLRSAIRLIPFEPVSFLAGEGWHDRASKTRVVRAI